MHCGKIKKYKKEFCFVHPHVEQHCSDIIRQKLFQNHSGDFPLYLKYSCVNVYVKITYYV